MNRFKFRAWIKEQYEWDTDADIPYRMVYLDTAEDGWVIDGATGEPMHGEGGTVTDFPYYVMQFTGIKDSNGKEIYEGDIIKYKDWFGDEWEWATIKIIWKETQAQFFPDILANFWPSDIKVIGNIYENKALKGE